MPIWRIENDFLRALHSSPLLRTRLITSFQCTGLTAVGARQARKVLGNFSVGRGPRPELCLLPVQGQYRDGSILLRLFDLLFQVSILVIVDKGVLEPSKFLQDDVWQRSNVAGHGRVAVHITGREKGS
jgi:hypothetical protein